MKPTRQPETAGSFSSNRLQWPPVEVPRRFRGQIVDSTRPRCRSLKPHAMLGVLVATSPRRSTGLRLRRQVPFPLSRDPSPHILGVLQGLGTDTPASGTAVETSVGTRTVRTPVSKIQSSKASNCSALAAVETPSVIEGSQVPNVAGATTQVLQQNVGQNVGTAVETSVGTRTVRTPVSKIQSSKASNCSALAAVETPSVIQGSQVPNAAGATTQVLQQNVGQNVGMAVETSVGTRSALRTPVSKIQSSKANCSALAAVETSSVIEGSEVPNVTGATTQVLQQNVKLHPVLGIFIPTRRRSSRCPGQYCPDSRVPELLSLFPGGDCGN